MENQQPKKPFFPSFFIFCLVVILVSIFGVVIFSYVSQKSALPKSNIPQPTNKPVSGKSISTLKTDDAQGSGQNQQWINCSDVRDILEENETMYIACLGGVLVINKNTGEVTDQITMTQGLGNSTVTNLAKQGNILYIGTQDGFTAFNVTTREAKKVSVKEGLTNGANSFLALDGDNLWVGTFEGLNLYNTKTGTITAYVKEIADNATTHEANKLLVTDKAVYVLSVANAGSAGAVSRFDKLTKSWERFGPAAFLTSLDQYSRIDMFDIVKVGNNMFVTDMKDLWQGEDTKGTTWKKVETINPTLKKLQSPSIRRIFGYNNKLYIHVNDFIYSLNNDALQLVYPPYEGENVIVNTSNNMSMHIDKIFYVTKTGSWIIGLDLETLKPVQLTLKNRPTEFGTLLAKIDDTLFFCSAGEIWEYNNQTGLFKKYTDVKCPSINEGGGTNVFIPIPGSNKIFTYSQECGMGCSDAQIKLFNYSDKSVKSEELPEKLVKEIKGNAGEWNFAPFMFKQYDSTNNQLVFYINIYENNQTKSRKISYDLKTLSWGQLGQPETVQNPQSPNASVFCNPVYSFNNANNSFNATSCKEIVDNGQYEFSLEETVVDAQGSKKTYSLDRKNLTTKEKTKLDFPQGAELPYSPFGTSFYARGFSNKLTLIKGNVFIPSNTGLYMYNVTNNSWKVLTAKDGLVSNNVTNYIVDNTNLWITTDSGGLSKIILGN